MTMYNLRTLIKYEYKKLLQRKSVWIVTLTLMLLTSVSVALPPFMTTVSIDDKFNYDSLSTPYIYEYCGSYKSILSSTVILTIMISFLTAICIPPVSADEHSRRTDQVILCTRFGRRPAFLAKIIAAASFAMCAVLLLFASATVPSFLIYGTEGFQAQIQVSLPGCSWDLTMGQAVLILTGISLAAAVLLSCAALLLAEIFKSSIPAAGILIGLLLISSFLNIPEQFRLLSQIWS